MASKTAYSAIRKGIIGGLYPPGSPLIAKTLSIDLGVSLTAVRHALRQLSVEGVVTIKAHLGATVRTMALKEYREQCGLRLALETYATGLAATNRSENDIRELELSLTAMRTLTREPDFKDDEQALATELSREDVRFHIAIIAAAKNRLMKTEILRLHLINRVVSGPFINEPKSQRPKPEQEDGHRALINNHEEILNAIQRRDVALAKRVMESHLQAAIDETIRRMERIEGEALSKALSEFELSNF